MVRKKKYHGGLLAFCCLLFVFLLGNISTCFALTPSNQLTIDIAESIIDKAIENGSYIRADSTNFINKLTSFKNSVNFNTFVNDWNNYINTTAFPYLENLIFIVNYNSNNPVIYIGQNNNEIGDNLPFVKCGYSSIGLSDYFTYSPRYITENNTDTSGYRFTLRFSDSGTYTFSNLTTVTAGNYM